MYLGVKFWLIFWMSSSDSKDKNVIVIIIFRRFKYLKAFEYINVCLYTKIASHKDGCVRTLTCWHFLLLSNILYFYLQTCLLHFSVTSEVKRVLYAFRIVFVQICRFLLKKKYRTIFNFIFCVFVTHAHVTMPLFLAGCLVVLLRQYLSLARVTRSLNDISFVQYILFVLLVWAM